MDLTVFVKFHTLVSWCSGYHICFTCKWARVRNSTKPMGIFLKDFCLSSVFFFNSEAQ